MKTPLAFALSLLSLLALPRALEAAIIERTLRYVHAGVPLAGLLVYDDEKTGPQPGVLLIHQWMGRGEFERSQAWRLAEAGYVAFALDMYGTQPRDTQEAAKLAGQFYGSPLMAERARAGLHQLLASGRVDPRKIAAIGYCFGGTAAMQLAYSGAELEAVVSFHGGLPAAPVAAAGQVDTKFLLCHGAADPLVPWSQVVATIESLEAAQIDYQLIAYQGAVHSFTDPSATGENPAAQYHEAAAERAWAHMLQFFKELGW